MGYYTKQRNGKTSIYILGFFFLILGLHGSAWAGGLYINDFGTPSMGTAGAGAEAAADDASAAVHNPAAMTLVEGNQLMVTGGLVVAKTEFDLGPGTPVPGGNGGDAGGLAPLLGTFYVHSVSDDLKLGLALFSLSAAALDYDDDWAGRYLVQEVSIMTLALNPTIAYRINDWFSVGAGIGIVYGALEMDVAVPSPVPMGPDGQATIDGDDVGFAYNLSVLLELPTRTRVGIHYRSAMEFEFSGDVEIQPVGFTAGLDTTLNYAQMVRLGIYQPINDRFAILSSLAWEDWSTLENLLISTEMGSAKIPRNWDDTYHISGGVQFRPVEEWLLQGGIAYDSSPVSSANRTPDMPIDRQIRYALGGQYTWSEKLTIGGAFEYLDMGNGKINNTAPNGLVGDFGTNNILFITLNANWKFGQ